MTRALWVTLALAMPLAAAVQVTVPSGATECFSVEAESFKHGISLNYEVLRGVADELETELTDGKQQVVYAHKGASGRYVGPIGEGGLHSVCFKNERSPVGDVALGFSFHADDPSHEVLSNADATKISECLMLWGLLKLGRFLMEVVSTLSSCDCRASAGAGRPRVRAEREPRHCQGHASVHEDDHEPPQPANHEHAQPDHVVDIRRDAGADGRVDGADFLPAAHARGATHPVVRHADQDSKLWHKQDVGSKRDNNMVDTRVIYSHHEKAVSSLELHHRTIDPHEQGSGSATRARHAGRADAPGGGRVHGQAAAGLACSRRVLRLRPDGGLAAPGEPAAGHRAAPLPARRSPPDSAGATDIWRPPLAVFAAAGSGGDGTDTRVLLLQVGGATGMIGDPSGKSEERVLLSDDTVLHNAQQIAKGLSAVLDFDDPKTGAIICNNAEWHTKMSAVTWMRDIGRVKKRLETDQGISFLEFSYQLFQAYDFLHLYKNYGCVAQIGGSDQWGNIASGIELVPTLALLTTATGEKYGKSAGNAIWLDAEKTYVVRGLDYHFVLNEWLYGFVTNLLYHNALQFDFYQFFLRSDDRDVEKLLKSFTFREVEEIRDIVAEHEMAPEKRIAQKVLAEDITVMMHGKEGLKAALDATELLFGKKTGPLTAEEMLRMAGDAPMTVLSRADVINQSLVDLAVQIGAAKSKGTFSLVSSSF
ncbi:unnamed protein product [Phytophthora lilii]|uniref:Tyrosine--tRNA ligase n=1 Tax=Phytophthora lilii TaxID=2077276 RepID=A0A9W6TTP8_9STRA|nr:unnamed protein product [Phytophthora lilii]